MNDDCLIRSAVLSYFIFVILLLLLNNLNENFFTRIKKKNVNNVSLLNPRVQYYNNVLYFQKLNSNINSRKLVHKCLF